MLDAGLDFGNKNCVLAVPQNGGVDIVANSSGKRLTPTLVGYAEDRRYFGEMAAINQVQNIETTIGDLKRLVGMKFESEEREVLQGSVQFKLAPLPDGLTGVDVKGAVLRPEQSIAFLFEELLAMAVERDNRIGGFVVAVSPWWTESHRRLILDAMKIARIPCSALVNSTTAAAVTYAVNHRGKLPEKGQDPVNVLFVDFGDSSMNVCVCKINREEVHVVSFACDEHLGGSHFTEALVSYLVKVVKEKYSFDPLENGKVALRFRKAVEVAKKNLSVNPVVPFELQDNGISFPLKREEFQSQIGHLISRIEAPIEKALELAKLEKSQLFATEVMGGASRVPAVKAEIQKIFPSEGKEPTQSLDLDECFATGTGYVSAILCPSFRISLDVHDICPYSVICDWEDAEGPKQCEIFSQFSVVPSSASLPISARAPVTVKVSHKITDKLCTIGTIDVEIPPSENGSQVSLQMRLTQSSILEVVGAFMSAEQLPVKFTCNLGLTEAEITKLQQDNDVLRARDRTELGIDNTKNELESLLFKVENGINRDFPECFPPDELASTRAKVAEIREWFDEHEFTRLSLADYQSKLHELTSVAKESIERHAIFKKLLDSAPSILGRADAAVEKLSAIASKVKDHKPDLQNLSQFVEQLRSKLTAVESMPRHITPDVKFEAVWAEVQQWEDKVNGIEAELKKKSEGRWCCVQ